MPRPRRPGLAASSSSPRSTGRAPASRSRYGSCSRPFCGRNGRSPRDRGRRVAGGRVQRQRAASVRGARSTGRSRAWALSAPPHARRLQTGSVGTYVVYLIGARHRPARRRAGRGDRVSADRPPRPRSQVLGGIALAPLLPGLVQHWKARLQGRRGPSPLQPYRELRRLWGKSMVDPRATGSSTGSRRRWSPRRWSAASWSSRSPGRAGLGPRPRRARAPRAARAGALRAHGRGLGHLERLLADGREPRPDALGVRRGEFVLALAVAALVAGTTDLVATSQPTAGVGVWGSPALALGAAAFALVVVAETGRQPVDNPDTHLELTMIHEGPLLEYAGRDLALPPVGRRRAALARARARRTGLPSPSARRRGCSSRCSLPRCSRSVRRSRSPRRCSRRCASCSCRGCSPSARRQRCWGSRLGSPGGMNGALVWIARGARTRRSSSSGGDRSRSLS